MHTPNWSVGTDKGQEEVCRHSELGLINFKGCLINLNVSYIAMLAAVDIVKDLQVVGINAIHIKLRGMGGVEAKTPGPGAQSAIRALARNGLKIGRIEDVTPTPTDSTRRGGGRRGRRL